MIAMVHAGNDVSLSLPEIFVWLDFAGVAVFAVTGALVAAETRQDIITTIFFAVLTGVGGGTVRDILIGAPVFWISQKGYLEVCLVGAVSVFLLETNRWPARLLTWLDAVGLSVYCVMGTFKALAFGVPPVTAAAMGVVTCSVGSIMRDVIAMRPSVLLNRELYITAAVVGAGLAIALIEFGMSHWAAGSIAAAAAFLTRAGAIMFGWRQPEKRD
jgi:uncharacterized membrane protein YeiH